jgi:hypothetical protein
MVCASPPCLLFWSKCSDAFKREAVLLSKQPDCPPRLWRAMVAEGKIEQENIVTLALMDSVVAMADRRNQQNVMVQQRLNGGERASFLGL